MKTKLEIPKDFYENKSYLEPKELLSMFTEMVKKIEELEEDCIANFEWAMRELEEKWRLKESNEMLKDALLRKDAEIAELKKQLGKEITA